MKPRAIVGRQIEKITFQMGVREMKRTAIIVGALALLAISPAYAENQILGAKAGIIKGEAAQQNPIVADTIKAAVAEQKQAIEVAPAQSKVDSPLVIPPPTINEPINPQASPKAEPQVVSKPNLKEEQALQPKDKDTNFKNTNLKLFNVEIEVNDLSSLELRRVVFYVRPQQIIKSTSWKLYIFNAKVKTWSESEVNRWALKVIEGKGVPPLNVIWNGMDNKGKPVARGKYFFLMTATDIGGQQYASDWFNLKLK